MTASKRNSRYLPKFRDPATPSALELNEVDITGASHYYQALSQPQGEPSSFVSGNNQGQDEGSFSVSQFDSSFIHDRRNEPTVPGFTSLLSPPTLPTYPLSFLDPMPTLNLSLLSNNNNININNNYNNNYNINNNYYNNNNYYHNNNNYYYNNNNNSNDYNNYNNYNDHNNYNNHNNHNNHSNHSNCTNYTNINPSVEHGHTLGYNTGEGPLNPVLASQSFSATPYAAGLFTPAVFAAGTPPGMYNSPYTSSLAQTLQTPILDPAIPGITADLDAMSNFGSAPGGLIPEAPVQDQVAMEINRLVDCAQKAGGRLLCPIKDCKRGLAGNPRRHAGHPRQKDGVRSKDSLRHHLRRIHFPPSERLHCPFDWCNTTFGHTPERDRHIKQIHWGHGHWCFCTGGKRYARLDALKKGCVLGLKCPGAIDYRETGSNA